MPEVKNIAKGELLVDVDKLVNFERRIEDQQETIGAYKQQVSDLKNEKLRVQQESDNKIKELKKEFAEKEERFGKEVKFITASEDSKTKCNHCGTYNTYGRNTCDWCGRTLSNTSAKGASISYKNLDDVVETIRKEEAKNLKVDVHKLEQEIEDLKVSNDKLYKENGRFQKQKEVLVEDYEATLTEARTATRKRYQKEVDAKDKKIEELNEELSKLNERLTDELIEENRKQEVITLKTRIDELEKQLAAVEEAAASKRGLRSWIEKRRKERLEKEAIQEKLEKEEMVDEISNNYPGQKSKWDFLKIGKRKIWNPFASRKKKADPYAYEETCCEYDSPYWF